MATSILRRALRIRPAALALALLALALLPAAGRAADFTPLLTGGQVTAQGSYNQDRSASGTNYDWETSDDGTSCSSQTCDDHTDFTNSDQLHLNWQSRWLLDGGYPDVLRASPGASTSAADGSYKVDPGTFTLSDHSTFQGYNDPQDGGGALPPEPNNLDCSQTMSSAGPPSLYAGGPDPSVAFNPYAPDDPAHTVMPDGTGELFATPNCQGDNGRTENGGIILGFPLEVQPAAHTFNLSTAPAEAASQSKHLDFSHSASGSTRDECTRPAADFVNGLNIDLHPTTPPETSRDTEHCAASSSGAEELTLECALCVTKWSYDQPSVRGGDFEAVPDSGTYDGNDVRITVTVHNATQKTISAPLRFFEAKAKRDLPEMPNEKHLDLTQTFAPGETRDLVFHWDTSGFAWESGKAFSQRDVRLLTPYGSAKSSITVRPKPVVLVHGLNSDASTWSAYSGFLKSANSSWQGFAVGDGQYPGRMDTDPLSGGSIAHNAQQENVYIEALRDRLNAAHVDLVVHSMGGLISRYYIQQLMHKADDGRPVATHLEMLGTPNEGSRCAEIAWGLHVHGDPIRELLPSIVAAFNNDVVNRKGVRFAIAAGVKNDQDGCFVAQVPLGPNDDVVSLVSAYWRIADRARFTVAHTAMTAYSAMFTSFVRPRLALDPDDAKAQAGAARIVPTARTAPAGEPSTIIGSRAKRTVVFPTLAGSYQHKVAPRGSATWRLRVGRYKRLAILISLPPGVTAKLLDPHGHIAARAGQGSTAGVFYSALSAAHPARGRWRVVVSNPNRSAEHIGASAIMAGGPQVKLVFKRAGRRVRIAARLSGAKAPRVGATVVLPKGRSQTVKLRTRGGVARGTTGKVARGAFITVTARAGGQSYTRVAEAP